MSETQRLFVAVSFNKAVHRRVAHVLEEHRGLAPHARFVREDNVHLTLCFLGSVQVEQVPKVIDVLGVAALTANPFSLKVEGGGTFGSKKSPRVLWMGISGEVEALKALQRELSDRLVPLGYQPEARPYAPHLTLARAADIKGDAQLLRCAEKLSKVHFGEFQVEELELWQSHLSPRGAQYTRIASAPLGRGKPL